MTPEQIAALTPTQLRIYLSLRQPGLEYGVTLRNLETVLDLRFVVSIYRGAFLPVDLHSNYNFFIELPLVLETLGSSPFPGVFVQSWGDAERTLKQILVQILDVAVLKQLYNETPPTTPEDYQFLLLNSITIRSLVDRQ